MSDNANTGNKTILSYLEDIVNKRLGEHQKKTNEQIERELSEFKTKIMKIMNTHLEATEEIQKNFVAYQEASTARLIELDKNIGENVESALNFLLEDARLKFSNQFPDLFRSNYYQIEQLMGEILQRHSRELFMRVRRNFVIVYDRYLLETIFSCIEYDKNYIEEYLRKDLLKLMDSFTIDIVRSPYDF